MKKKPNEKRLSLNKMKILQITNLQTIKGGDDETQIKTRCIFPENASKPQQQGGIKI